MLFSKQHISKATVGKDSFSLNEKFGKSKRIVQIQIPCHYQCLKNTY